MRDNNYVASAERVMRILEIISGSPRPLTLTEIANAAILTKTTTQRFINTLCKLKYLARDSNKKYFIGTKVLSLGLKYFNGMNLVSIAKPYVDELSFELGMTVNLGILDKVDVIILYRRAVKNFLRFELYPGSKLPAYVSSMGRILLAGLNDNTIKKIIGSVDIQRLTPRTLISRSAITKEIYKVRKKGYAISDQELSMDLCSIAAPLLDKSNELIAAVNVSMEIINKENPGVMDGVICKLLKKGEAISRHLEYEGQYPIIYPKI